MMELTDTQTYIFIAVILALAVFGIMVPAVLTIKRSASGGRAVKDEPCDDIEEIYEDYDAEIVETHGVISKMECYTLAGGKGTQTAKKFYILFTDDYGNEKEFYIDEESYLGLDINVPGTLGTYNGNFYGFCFDEEK